MQIVAIHQLQGNTEELARQLAAVLGLTPYEARPRVSIPGGGPAIVASFAEAEPAEQCVTRLENAGFHALIISSKHIEADATRVLATQLHFAPETLQIITRDGQQLELQYSEISLLLRGAGIISATELATSTKKKFSIGRAVATGGLVMRKNVKTVTETTTQERQPFCHIYTTTAPPVVLRQDAIDYAALGENRQLSRDANFNWICAELRRRCPDAVWDDRLQTKPGLAQLLGPAFAPENFLDLAITLVARSRLATP